MKNSVKKGLLLLGLSFVILSCGDKEKTAKVQYPDKPIEMVVPYSAGGGSDRNGRTLAEIVQKYKMAEQPIMVVNKPGGSGAVGNAYVHSKKGNDYTLLTMVGGQAASAIYNKAEVTVDKFTPIAVLAYDVMFLGINKNSKYKNLKEVVEAAKNTPGSITVGGPNIGNEEFYAYKLLEKQTGAKFKYVSFNGTGDVISAMLGDHVDIGVLKPAATMSQVESKNIIPLVSYTPEKLGGVFEDTPTFKELDYGDVDVRVYRAIVGPPNMNENIVTYWEEIFKKVSETPEWKDEYVKQNFLVPNFLGATEAKKFILEDQEKFATMFSEID